MVSWGRAFRGAAAVVGFAIIWWIIGAALVSAGFYISGGFGLYGSSGATYSAIGIGAILIFCGSIISILGVFAAFLKVLPEIVAEEVRGK
ncbi:MAG: hypothetical protein HXS44_02770 [Theionarchaea archaeon]|nr:hypothetical protein [Theionarchaea archaeon]